MPARILVIENEPQWYDLFREILMGMGYQVDIAEDFKKAVTFLKASSHALILLDMCLDQSEFTLVCQQFCDFLHRQYPKIPVVGTTGKRLEPPEMFTLMKLGVIEFIYKPKIDLLEFRRRISELLQKNSAEALIMPELPPLPALFRYDVFISYSHLDQQWVHETLLPKLEAKGLRVCIDSRDFKPGALSLNEMERAVLESEKTLLVLTPNYVASEWTRFEEVMAQQLNLDAKSQHILPLLLQPSELPLHLRALTYLDCTQPDKVDAQIDRLVASIKFDQSI